MAWADTGSALAIPTGATATALTAGTMGYLSPAAATSTTAAEEEAVAARTAEDCRATAEDVEELSTSMDEGETDGDIEDGDDGGGDGRVAELDVVDPMVTGVGVDNTTGPDVKFTMGMLMGLSAAVPEVVGAAVVIVEVRSDVTGDVEVITLLTDTGGTVGTVDMLEVDPFLCWGSVPRPGPTATTMRSFAEVGTASNGRAVVDLHERRKKPIPKWRSGGVRRGNGRKSPQEKHKQHKITTLNFMLYNQVKICCLCGLQRATDAQL